MAASEAIFVRFTQSTTAADYVIETIRDSTRIVAAWSDRGGGGQDHVRTGTSPTRARGRVRRRRDGPDRVAQGSSGLRSRASR